MIQYQVSASGLWFIFFRDMLKKISAVTESDLKKVGEKYIAPIFKSNQIRRAICCNPSKVDEVVESFKE